MYQNLNFPRTKQFVKTQCATVFSAQNGLSYAHHPYIAYYKGKLIACFSCGKKNEDDLGQRVFLSYSEDFYTWSKPIAIEVTGRAESVDTACGFYEQDGVLYLFVGSYDYERSHVKNGARVFSDSGHVGTRLYVLQSEDGVNFYNLQKTNLCMIPNMSPKKLRNGKIIICGNFSMPTNTDIRNVTGWTDGGLDCQTKVDDSQSFYAVSEKLGLDTVVCECDVFEREDKLVAFFRSQKREKFGWIYASESADGRSWSKPFKTDFTNDTSKFCVGVLSNGKYYYVGNPIINNSRNPLALSLSTDGENFTEHYVLGSGERKLKYSGFAKFGAFGYPFAMERDGMLYVIYSVNKEDIECRRIALSDL